MLLIWDNHVEYQIWITIAITIAESAQAKKVSFIAINTRT
jgi:hypothetical protein